MKNDEKGGIIITSIEFGKIYSKRKDLLKMKSKRTKITACLLALIIIISAVSLTSCSTYYSNLLEYYRELDQANNSQLPDDPPSSDSNTPSNPSNPTIPDEDTSKDTISPDIMDENFSASDVEIPEIIGGEETVYAVAQGLRSVVSIYCSYEVTSGGTSIWNPTPSTQTYYSSGSGVVYKTEDDGSAFIITNYHVVYENGSNTKNHISDKIFIYLYGMINEKYAIPATFVGGSANYDIAVLRVDKSEVLKKAIERGSITAVQIGDSDSLLPGQTAIAIGNPATDELGGISVTGGIISVDSEYISMTALDSSGTVEMRVIRTDAPVNSGNSGGGLFNDSGKLIGIVNAKIISSNVENIGYAIPSSVVRAVADNVIDNCYKKDCESVQRGMLGITITTSGLSTYYDEESGLLIRAEQITVYEITAGGIGEKILKVGDIIKSVTVGDRTVNVTRQYHLIDAMLDLRAGDTILMTVTRDGIDTTVSAIITKDCLMAY